jgi:protein-disulfide isomerase
MRQKLGKICAAILLMIISEHAGLAQKSAPNMQNEIEALKKGQAAINKELQEIKDMLISIGARPPEKDIRGIDFELANYPIKGSSAARLIMVDFTDYQCPYCGRYARETLPEIIKQYVDSGKLRYAILDLPLPNHQKAPKAAEASHCAGDQGKFWEMHDQMMAKQESLDNLSSYATSLNLDINRFEDCLKTNSYAVDVRKPAALASKLDVRAVPGFVLAESDPKTPLKLKAITSIRGAMPLEDFQSEIDKALANLSK